MSISSDIRQKERYIRDLSRYKSDLTDDSSDITRINRLVAQLQEDLQRCISSDNINTVVDKIGDYLEPYQSRDHDLNRACGYIDNEITSLNREIASLERALEELTRARAAIGGKS